MSLEVSPLLAYDTAQTLAAARTLHAKAGRPNLFIKIPGTREGIPAIEEAIFQGVPVNVTLLFSTQQYQAAAEAYVRGLERRVAGGPEPRCAFGRFAVRQPLGQGDAWRSCRQRCATLWASPSASSPTVPTDNCWTTDRWQRLMNLGARPQRLLFASTGVKDPSAPDTMYVTALAAPEYGEHHAGGDAAGLR